MFTDLFGFQCREIVERILGVDRKSWTGSRYCWSRTENVELGLLMMRRLGEELQSLVSNQL